MGSELFSDALPLMPWRRPDAGSLAEHRADGEFLAAAVEQVREIQRFTARQLQTGQTQGVLAAGDDQAVLAGAENGPRRALPFGKIGRQYFQGFVVQRAVADRPWVEGADQTPQFIGRTAPVDARFILVQFVRVIG